MRKFTSKPNNEAIDGEESPKESRKLKIMLYIEMGLLVFLAVAIVLKYTNVFEKFGSNENQVAEQQDNSLNELSPEEREEILYTADEAIGGLYASLFPGNYTTEEGKKFFFNPDGSTFTGYIGKGHEDENGTYSLSTNDGINYVTIKSGKNEKKYSFIFTSEGSVNLTDLDTEEILELK